MTGIDVLGQFAKADTLRNNEERAKHNRLFEAAQMKQIEQQQAAAEEKRLRDSYLEGAANLKALIENGQTDRVMPYLQGREQDILSRNGDPSETRQVMQMAQAGDFQNILNLSNANLQAAAQLGYAPPIPQAKDTRTTQQKNFEAVQANPEFGEFLTNQKKAGATNIKTVVDNATAKGLTEEQKALAKSRVAKFQGIQDTAQAAIDQNEQLSQLANMDISSGFGQSAKVQLARVFNSFGANGDDLIGVDAANAQAFNAVSGKLLAEALAAQKGPQTDKDADRMMDTLPKLSNEQDANRFIIGSMKAINERKIEQAEFYTQVLEKEGTLKDADKLWREYKRKTPLLSENLMNKETGLPIFFNEFYQQAQARNPDATRDQIIEAWRKLND